MKIIVNLENDYIALPSGPTINAGGSMPVLNEAILDSPVIKEWVEQGRIRIDERAEKSDA
jgi:hypothetical protein